MANLSAWEQKKASLEREFNETLYKTALAILAAQEKALAQLSGENDALDILRLSSAALNAQKIGQSAFSEQKGQLTLDFGNMPPIGISIVSTNKNGTG